MAQTISSFTWGMPSRLHCIISTVLASIWLLMRVPTEGVFVEMDDFPGKDTKLVIVPNPVRILLNVDNDKQQVVWTAK